MDHVVDLNNYLSAQGKVPGLSWREWSTGPAHQPDWHAVAKFGGEVIGYGRGSYRREARDEAAAEALQYFRTGLLHSPETIYDRRERMIDWEGIFDYPVPYPACTRL